MTELLDDAMLQDDALDDAFEADGFEGDGADAYDELDELRESADADDLDSAWDELDAAEDYADEVVDDFESDSDDLDSVDGFTRSPGSGLYLPAQQPLISGTPAVAMARRLNPFVLESMDADEADAFFRRIGRSLRRVGAAAARGVRTVGRVAGRAARVAAPLLRRALPMIQRVAGMAGPWGRLVSAGIGAARGLASGRGLRGALAGAVGGLVPGVGGRIARSILGGDGADDDAALDALADMSDAGEVSPGVALPLGAGLAARVATPRTPTGAWPASLRRGAQAAEQTMMQAASAAGGPAGRRLRVLRAIARMARAYAARRGPAAGARVLPAATRAAAQRVLANVQRNPSAGVSSRTAAAARLRARRQLLNRLPVSALYPGLRSAAA
jgi:hypothetical protein